MEADRANEDVFCLRLDSSGVADEHSARCLKVKCHKSNAYMPVGAQDIARLPAIQNTGDRLKLGTIEFEYVIDRNFL